MSKRPKSASKRLTQGNLEALGTERLVALLMELADSQPNLKRRLRMELAAEVGACDLAEEIDKRVTMLATSRAKVSWRKRGELIVDLHALRRIIGGRLGELDPALGMARLVVFLDLAEDLAMRVKDPKGELAAVFAAAAQDLGALAERSPPAGPELVEALADILVRARPTWSAWLAAALPGMGRPFSRDLLAAINAQREARPALRPSSQVLRVVADVAGDADAFIETIPAALRTEPGTGAAIATRLLEDGRVEAALAALKTSDPRDRGGRRGLGRSETGDGPGIAAWQDAYIEALEQSGNAEAAQAERWASFEQTLSADHLRAFLKRLADFDDVVATDEALDLAAVHARFGAALDFLMTWPALAEAARMIVARRSEIEGDPDDLVAWSARLEGRYALAALLLLRAALTAAWPDRSARSEVEIWLHEAESLASRIEDLKGAETHEAFVVRLTARRGVFNRF